MPNRPSAQSQYLDDGNARFMKPTDPATPRSKTTSRKSAAEAQRESDARYRQLFETEVDIPAAVPNQLQNHVAESLLMLDLLDLARDLAANVTIARAEVAAFEQIVVAQIRRSFHTASRWAAKGAFRSAMVRVHPSRSANQPARKALR